MSQSENNKLRNIQFLSEEERRLTQHIQQFKSQNKVDFQSFIQDDDEDQNEKSFQNQDSYRYENQQKISKKQYGQFSEQGENTNNGGEIQFDQDEQNLIKLLMKELSELNDDDQIDQNQVNFREEDSGIDYIQNQNLHDRYKIRQKQQIEKLINRVEKILNCIEQSGYLASILRQQKKIEFLLELYLRPNKMFFEVKNFIWNYILDIHSSMLDSLLEGENIYGQNLEHVLQRFSQRISFLYFPTIEGIPKSVIINYFVKNQLEIKKIQPEFDISILDQEKFYSEKKISFQQKTPQQHYYRKKQRNNFIQQQQNQQQQQLDFVNQKLMNQIKNKIDFYKNASNYNKPKNQRKQQIQQTYLQEQKILLGNLNKIQNQQESEFTNFQDPENKQQKKNFEQERYYKNEENLQQKENNQIIQQNQCYQFDSNFQTSFENQKKKQRIEEQFLDSPEKIQTIKQQRNYQNQQNSGNFTDYKQNLIPSTHQNLNQVDYEQTNQNFQNQNQYVQQQDIDMRQKEEERVHNYINYLNQIYQNQQSQNLDEDEENRYYKVNEDTILNEKINNSQQQQNNRPRYQKSFEIVYKQKSRNNNYSINSDDSESSLEKTGWSYQ